MKHGRQLVLFAVALTLLASVGCVKKKPHLPAQAKAPAYPIATPLPGEISETVTASEEPEPQEETTATKEEPAPKPPKRRRRKPASPPPAQTATTPANGSANSTVAMAHPPANPAEPPADMAIAADVTSAQLLQQKQNTAHLLDETEKTISGLKRSLSEPEQEMLAQIRSYVAQSRKATTDGDFERAYNLATKAHLLSDALVKQ